MTIALHVNQLLEIDGPTGMRVHRILHVAADQVALFDVEDRSALPKWTTLTDLAQEIGAERVRPVDEDRFAPDYSSDEDLTDAAKRVRDARLQIILPLVSPDADPSMPVLHGRTRGQLIQEATAQHGVVKDKVYAWLRLWWRHGQIDNALLPGFARCGQGSRDASGAKRGRKLTKGKSFEDHVGVNVDAQMQRLILRGARRPIRTSPPSSNTRWRPRPAVGASWSRRSRVSRR